jgi:hypothetical protein
VNQQRRVVTAERVEALLEALLADLLAESDDNALEAGHGDDFRDREAVRWHVAMFWGFYRKYRTVMIALQQAATVDESFARRQQAMLEPDLHHVAGHLAGLDLPGDPLVTATIFTRLVTSFAAMWLSPTHPDLGRELSDAEAIETLTSFIHAGLGGRRT